MKPVFDENGLATVPGDMRCFYYDAETALLQIVGGDKLIIPFC